jgi:hypothetical protein
MMRHPFVVAVLLITTLMVSPVAEAKRHKGHHSHQKSSHSHGKKKKKGRHVASQKKKHGKKSKKKHGRKRRHSSEG